MWPACNHPQPPKVSQTMLPCPGEETFQLYSSPALGSAHPDFQLPGEKPAVTCLGAWKKERRGMNHRPLERNRKICPVYVCENKASQFYLLAGPTSPLGLQDPFANPEPTVCDVSFPPPPTPPTLPPRAWHFITQVTIKSLSVCACVHVCAHMCK